MDRVHVVVRNAHSIPSMATTDLKQALQFIDEQYAPYEYTLYTYEDGELVKNEK